MSKMREQNKENKKHFVFPFVGKEFLKWEVGMCTIHHFAAPSTT